MSEYFFLITMLGKNGKVLYLGCTDNTKVMKWYGDYDKACWFPTDYDASHFARGYFKNFKGWSITVLDYKI